MPLTREELPGKRQTDETTEEARKNPPGTVVDSAFGMLALSHKLEIIIRIL
jgi:hypothetical protein